MIPFNLVPPAPTSLSDSIMSQSITDLRPPSGSRRMRGPVPPSASIHPQRVELVCSYNPGANVSQGKADESNSPPLISPIEPVLRAVLMKDPNYNFSGLDFITSRTNLRRLFRLVSVSGSRRKAPGELKFYVELIRPSRVQAGCCDAARTVLLSSGNLQEDDADTIGDDAGDDHGAEFLEHHSEIMNADKSTETSISDARVVTYDFGGMRCMIKYPPIEKLPTAQARGKNIQEHDEENEKCWRVRKKTKVRVINHVDEWRRKVQDGALAGATQPGPHHNGDLASAHNHVSVAIAGDEVSVPNDVEAWRLEQLDQLVDLSNAMGRVGLHSRSRVESDVQHDDVGGSPEIKMASLKESQSSRQRGDSVSSTSSAQSQASSQSIVSSRSSVSWTLGEGPHHYHYHKKLQLLPTIAPTPPNELVSYRQYLGFDTPISNLWYRPHLSSSFFNVAAVEPLDFQEDEIGHKGAGSDIVGTYRSTSKYKKVLQTWEKEHVENLRKLVDVLRKIRKAADKAGRCKVVVESSGRIRPYRVKQSKEEKEEEVGRVSILPPDLLIKWV